MRIFLLKKTYSSPEFNYLRFALEDTICVSDSTETPIDDIIEHDDDGDL